MKNKMKTEHKVAAATLALMITTPSFLNTAQAATENTPKEEVVYINLNADGSVEEVNVVNIFDLTTKGKITDYGAYESVRNMTTNDLINYANHVVEIEADQGKLYYEGKLENEEIPWNIDIHYYLDGKEYQADEIAGKSGELEITISIRKNEKVETNFFESYALQATLLLDTNQCKNIVAEDATVANVGSDKQLTYTILPGKETDIKITADVTDFEMDAIAINGIPLNLNIEVDDEELMDRVTELIDAIAKLDDGAEELNDGTSELQDSVKNDLQSGVTDLDDGAQELRDGAKELKDGGSTLRSGALELDEGAADLQDGIASLNDGILQVQSGLATLNRQSKTLTNGSAQIKSALVQIQTALSGVSMNTEQLNELVQASSQIKSGIDALVSGVTQLEQSVSYDAYASMLKSNELDVNQLYQQNEAAATTLMQSITALQEQLATLSAMGMDTTEIATQLSQLESIAKLLRVNNITISATESYLTELQTGVSKLVVGATQLQTSYTEFDGVITELANTLGNLAYKMTELSTAINTLVTEYTKLDSGIVDYTDGVAQIVAGYSQLTTGSSQLVSGSKTLKSGTASLYSGTNELLSGIVEIYNGTGTLKDGTGQLDDGVAELLAGVIKLKDGMDELKDGTNTMREETDGMDSEISDQIDELIDTITGGDQELVSFVSSQNTNVNAVQFVMTGESIAIEEDEKVEEAESEAVSFWDKLINLFKQD